MPRRNNRLKEKLSSERARENSLKKLRKELIYSQNTNSNKNTRSEATKKDRD